VNTVMDLSGKVAVVTGSGRGLGLAYAKALAHAGACVVINDVDDDAAKDAVRQIAEAGGTATSLVAAVGPAHVADALVTKAVDEFGRLDIMVTNAGILRDGVLWKMSDESFDEVIDVHLRGTFTCARAAANRFREQGDGGRLILISSPAGQLGNFGQSNYAAAKAGIVAMARTWAMELARANVTVNAVIPVAATEMTKTLPAFAPFIAASESTGAPLPGWIRRDEALGTVEDVAPLIVFLASEKSADVTGQAIGIGGDQLALWSHPKVKIAVYSDGGWTAADIAAAWAAEVGAEPEPFGIPSPQVPEAHV